MGFFTGTVVNDAATLMNRINAGESFTTNDAGQIKTQSSIGKFFQKLGDIFLRSHEQNAARDAKLDAAMANLISRSNPIPNPTSTAIKDLKQSISTLSARYGKTISMFQLRLDNLERSSGKAEILGSLSGKIDYDKVTSISNQNMEFDEISGWKRQSELDKGQVKAFEDAMKNDANEYLKTFNKPENIGEKNCHQQFIKDLDISDIKIDGKSCGKTNDEKIKAMNKNFSPKQMNFLTSIINQQSMAPFTVALQDGECNGTPVPDGFPTQTDNVIFATQGSKDHFLYDISKDHKDPHKVTVKLSSYMTMKIKDPDVAKEDISDFGVGKLPFTMTFSCDLPDDESGKPCSVTGLKIGYDIGKKNLGIMEGGVSDGFMSRLNAMHMKKV